MKREFAFDDALRMLEVLWASLPQKSPVIELSLKEKEYNPTLNSEDGDPPPLSPLIKAPRENAYTKVCAIRRQSSSFSLANVKAPKLSTCKQMNYSLDENETRKILTNTSLQNAKEFQSLDDATLGLQKTETKKNDNKKDEVMKPKRCINRIPENGRHLNPNESIVTCTSTENLKNSDTQTVIKETPLGNQIRMLRDKISLHNNKFFSSLEKLNTNLEVDPNTRPNVKMVKNLNEFLNLATGSKQISVRQDKLARANSVIVKTSPKEYPTVMFPKTSFDENDLSVSRTYREQKLTNKVGKNLYSDSSSPDDSQEYYPMTTSMTRELKLELEHLDRQVYGQSFVSHCTVTCDSPSESVSTDEKVTNTICEDVKKGPEVNKINVESSNLNRIDKFKKSPLLETVKSTAKSIEDIYLWENPLHRNTPTTRTTTSCPQTPDEQAELDFDGDNGEIFEELSGKKSITPIRLLRKNYSFEPQDLTPESKHSNIHSSESDSSENDGVVTKTDATISSNQQDTASRSHKFFSNMSQELENAKRNCESLLNAKQTSNLHSVATTINNFQKKYEVFKPPVQKHVVSTSNGTEVSSKNNSVTCLPPPTIFGGGNPFLMFLCLTVLLQHRDYIMRNHMDYNELAMHFDKMVRKHNVNRVLNQARQMYAIYLKQHSHKMGDITT